MTKIEFIDYLTYLKGLFPKASIPKSTDKEIIGIWYKGFINTNLIVAKSMAEMYFQDEQNSFNYARLMQYKSKAMADKTYYDKPKGSECKLCGNTGYIQFRGYDPNIKADNDLYKRCICDIGNSIRADIAQATQEELINITPNRVILLKEIKR